MTEERKDSFASKAWQAKISRRRFLGASAAIAGAAGFAGVLPDSVLRAASASAATPQGGFDLSQIKHLVFLMQENRSFDHYFGTFPGVVGYSDPHAMKLPTGQSIFQQPDPDNPDSYLEPFHLDTIHASGDNFTGNSHDWRIQHDAWAQGAMDGWVRAHIMSDATHGPYTMAHYNQDDIPFQWALAEAFTLADQYHCSAMGPTFPNRSLWLHGTNDPQGLGNGPILETVTPPVPLTFESGPETIYNAGLTIKGYNPSAGLYYNQWFKQFMSGTTLPAALVNSVCTDGTLWGDGTPGGLGNPASPTKATVGSLAFEEDCSNGVLPDVSFVGTEASEHPGNGVASVAYGAQFLAQILDALASNEDLWNTTALVIQYDENDGWFDHVPPPTPNKAEYPEEFVTKPSNAGTPGGGYPVGGGFRVPCYIISPWTTGGQIFSEVSDHTSCLRLIEAVAAAGGLSGRGPVHFPNISRWRRDTFGDLTSVFHGRAKPAPSSPQFDASVRADQVTAHIASSSLPLTPLPGATQSMPQQVRA